MIVDLPNPAATDALGDRLSAALIAVGRGGVVTLAGDLGAGKTSLTRAVIKALGHAGPVLSPSYTLMEPYLLAGRTFYHLDLYRLGDPEELEFIGIRDLSPESDWLFVEWAENGLDFLPPADLAIELAYRGDGRSARLTARSANGRRWLEKLGS